MAVKRRTTVGDVIKSVESNVSVNETSSDMARVMEMASTLKNLKSVATSDVSKEISELKMFTTSTLDSLANSIIGKLGMLEQIDKAINFQQENLERVNKITIAATTLESLLLAQETQRQAFNEEMDLVKKQWQRDQDAYKYQLSLEKRNDADSFEALKKKRILELEDFCKGKLNDLADKETALNKQKAEYDLVIVEAKEFPARLEHALNSKEQEVRNQMMKDFEFQLRIAQKDSENAARLADQTIRSQTARINELEKQITDLRIQESKATERVQQIAEKAIENSVKSNTVFVPNQQNENFVENKRK